MKVVGPRNCHGTGAGFSARVAPRSPIHADLQGLPSLLLQVGQVDLFRDDSVCLAALAGRAGVEVTLEIYPEMIHGFQGLAHAGIPEAVAAIRRVADYVGARL